MKSIIIFLVLLLSAVSQLPAQIVQPHRFEVEQKNSDEPFTVISLHEEGIALVRERNKFSGSKRMWEVTILDTTLQEKAKIEHHVEQRYPLIGYETAPGFLYLLFRAGEAEKDGFLLIEFPTTQKSDPEKYDIEPELNFQVTHFSKVSSSIVLGGYVSSDPAVVLYDLAAKTIKVVPGFFQKDNELVDLRVNQNQTFNVVLIDRSTRSDRRLIFRTFDKGGNLLLEDLVPIDDDKSLQTSITSTLKREDLTVLGTWGEKIGKQSMGIFSLPVDPFAEQKINYFYFGQLQHFVDYLPERRAARIKANTESDLKDGKKPNYSPYVIPYSVIEDQDGYVLIAEVYSPQSPPPTQASNHYSNPYFANPYNYYNPFYNGYYPGMRVYRPQNYGANVKNTEEIKIYSTAIIAFDGKGNVRWDESIKLDEVKRPALEQVADFYQSRDALYVVYRKESDLKVKKILRDDGTATDFTEKIKTKEEGDEIRHETESDGGVKFWTNNSFFVWGYQTIRNNNRKGDKTNDVFYINKVVAY